MITPFAEDDQTHWAELWRQYLEFYSTVLPPETYDVTWHRLIEDRQLHGFAWRHEGRLAGIVHYLFHDTAWAAQPVCYLQDLFVQPGQRGTGAGRALIEAVAGAARGRSAVRLYWLTQTHNDVARTLYDRLAKHTGFIRYEYPL